VFTASSAQTSVDLSQCIIFLRFQSTLETYVVSLPGYLVMATSLKSLPSEPKSDRQIDERLRPRRLHSSRVSTTTLAKQTHRRAQIHQIRLLHRCQVHPPRYLVVMTRCQLQQSLAEPTRAVEKEGALQIEKSNVGSSDERVSTFPSHTQANRN
jgi:hypothetical protein